jgi:hypothetical protein
MHMHAPNEGHWKAMEHCIRYVRFTKDRNLGKLMYLAKHTRPDISNSSAWELQNQMNGWDVTQMTPGQIIQHYKLVDHFTMNLDESCM